MSEILLTFLSDIAIAEKREKDITYQIKYQKIKKELEDFKKANSSLHLLSKCLHVESIKFDAKKLNKIIISENFEIYEQFLIID